MLNGRSIIITSFGGLIESFFSLCAAEAIVSFESSQKLYWLGNSKYHPLLRAQGLCKPSSINMKPEILKQYPVPLFLDNGGNAYFNILNNYLFRTSYWGKYTEEVHAPIFEQMARNIMIPWHGYVPKLRNLGNEFLDDMFKIGRLRPTSKVISIILDDTNNDILQWSIQNIREFAQLSSHKGWKVIVFTNNTNALYGPNVLTAEYNYRNILQAVNNSWVVMSNDIDWLLISIMTSDARIISTHIDNQYSLFKNAEFLGVHNDIFTNRNLLPVDAFGICEGL